MSLLDEFPDDPVVGNAIPDRLRELAWKWHTSVHRVRQCVVCHFNWKTAEVRIRPEADMRFPEFCHDHRFRKATRNRGINTNVRIWTPRKPRLAIPEGVAAVRIGAVLRRRTCYCCKHCTHGKHHHRVGGCMQIRTTYMAKYKRVALGTFLCKCKSFERCSKVWFTVEVDAAGLIVEDVSRCPICGGRSWVPSRLKCTSRGFPPGYLRETAPSAEGT